MSNTHTLAVEIVFFKFFYFLYLRFLNVLNVYLHPATHFCISARRYSVLLLESWANNATH